MTRTRDLLHGEHYCSRHQGNHSHYDERNCTVCKMQQALRVLEGLSEASRQEAPKGVMYYVITNDEDGVRVSEHTKEDLEEKLNTEYWGEVHPKQACPGESPEEWNSPSEQCSMLIIKGEIVTKYEVP